MLFQFLFVLVMIPSNILVQAFFLYENKRCYNGIEFLTDGYAPEAVAHNSQQFLKLFWLDGFRNAAVSDNGEPFETIARYLKSMDAGTHFIFLELASGSGVAATKMVQILRNPPYKITAAKLYLSDLQTNTEEWNKLKLEYGENFVDFIPFPVDATNVNKALHSSGNKTLSSQILQVRLINLALHHFQPSFVHSIFVDVIKSKSAFLSTDLAPTHGGLIYNPLILNYIFTQEGSKLTRKFMETPSNLPWMTVLPWLTIHDSLVSLLRSYSAEQLEEIFDAALKTAGGSRTDFDTYIFHSKGYPEWFGVPKTIRSLLPQKHDPVLQFFLILPKS